VPLIAFDYRFRVGLPVAADEAYRWATDYAPDDWARMGHDGRRRIVPVADRTLILVDTVRTGGRLVTKRRLVRLYPSQRAWTNTHLVGTTRHSQFWYRIVPRGPRRSVIEFTGLQVEPSPRRLSGAALARRAREVAREDSTLWRRLSRVMGEELAGGPARGRKRRA
jgi:hypothetical protein